MGGALLGGASDSTTCRCGKSVLYTTVGCFLIILLFTHGRFEHNHYSQLNTNLFIISVSLNLSFNYTLDTTNAHKCY